MQQLSDKTMKPSWDLHTAKKLSRIPTYTKGLPHCISESEAFQHVFAVCHNDGCTYTYVCTYTFPYPRPTCLVCYICLIHRIWRIPTFFVYMYISLPPNNFILLHPSHTSESEEFQHVFLQCGNKTNIPRVHVWVYIYTFIYVYMYIYISFSPPSSVCYICLIHRNLKDSNILIIAAWQ